MTTQTETKRKTIEVENAGPIPQLTFSVEDYGVTILTGPNGAGKSFLLDATQKAATGKGRIPVTDGKRRGSFKGLGAIISLGASTRHKGSFEVESLEGKFDVATLVDPQMKDAASADNKRIKALVTLMGVEADAKLFKERGEFDDFADVVNPSSIDTTDLCDMAFRIKRDYDAAARAKEQEADREENHAVACEARIEGIDFSGDHDIEKARKRHSEMLANLSSLRTRKETADEHRAHIEKAKAKLAEIKANHDGPSLKALVARQEVEHEALLKARQRVKELEEQLNAAENYASDCEIAASQADKDVEVAQQHAREIESLEETINSPMAKPVTEEDLKTAELAVETAELQYDSARKLSEAVKDRDEGKSHREKCQALKNQADSLRETGRAVEDVLSDVIQCDQLYVATEDGKVRLMTDHPVRGEKVPFHELSEGERWKIAIDLGANRVGKGGLLVIPQVAWESLDCYTRPQVHEHAKEREVYILTAEATRDESEGRGIKAKPYEATV